MIPSERNKEVKSEIFFIKWSHEDKMCVCEKFLIKKMKIFIFAYIKQYTA